MEKILFFWYQCYAGVNKMSIKKDLRNVPKTFDLGLLDLFDQFPRCADENVIILDDISFSYTEFDALELGELTSSVNNE